MMFKVCSHVWTWFDYEQSGELILRRLGDSSVSTEVTSLFVI